MNQNILEQTEKNLPKLMLFELSWGGHYPEYLAHLINYWHQTNLKCNLFLVFSSQFCQRHPEVINLVRDKVSLTTITPKEEQNLLIANSTPKRILRGFQEFKLACKYARRLEVNEILFTYFDTRQLPLACGQKLPCPCSGIYFRPRFHYGNLTDEQIGWREKLAMWQEKLLLMAALKNPQLKCIFSLDPFAVKYFSQFCSRVKTVALPDPIEMASNLNIDSETLKAGLGIEQQRMVLLLFGGLTKRKGIFPLLEAISSLPPQLTQKICLLFVGPISSTIQAKTQQKISSMTESLPIQIITDDRYVSSEQEKQRYFQIADVILAPYQRHIGMSAIIIRAALAQKPVLSSDYGLMGEITRRYQLGLTVDTSKPQEIAEGIKKLLAKSPGEFINCDRARQFAQQNSPVNFAHTIFQHLGLTQ